MAEELYIFSGLGADERVFQRLDFGVHKTTFIKWIPPNDNETIEQYSTRLLDQITATKPILIGLSFGGIVAIEVAKQIDSEKIVLIASAKTRNEIPFYFRFVGRLGFHKMIPVKILKMNNFITNWFFSVHSSFDKRILKQILIDTDPIFLKWAIDKTLKWTNKALLKNVFHIHGDRDRILPSVFVNCDAKVKNGGHLMTLTESDAVNAVLRGLLGTEEKWKQ